MTPDERERHAHLCAAYARHLAEAKELRRLIMAMAERIAVQSELLSKKAEKK